MIRPARREDARALAELELRAWRWAYVDIVPDEDMPSVGERAECWLAHAVDGTVVLEQDGLIAGFAGIGPCPGEGPEHGVLRSLYVEPAAQGAGVGAALHDDALDRLRAGGFTAASLWVFTANGHAREFYARRGWIADGRAGQWQGVPELRLSRSLVA